VALPPGNVGVNRERSARCGAGGWGSPDTDGGRRAPPTALSHAKNVAWTGEQGGTFVEPEGDGLLGVRHFRSAVIGLISSIGPHTTCQHVGVFDDFLREIHKLTQPQLVPIQMEIDDEGYLDRRCPGPECGAAFKVLFTDWRDKVEDAHAWCAICGEAEEASEFNTPDQLRQITDQAVAHIAGQLDEAARRARKRTVRAGFITMTWSYKPGTRPLVVIAQAAPLMTQHSTCEQCGALYASVGAAFFCPACGHNGARTTFAGALTTVRALMDLTEKLPTVIEDRDAAADAARHMVENSLVRVWSLFQRFAEATYKATPASATTPARRNAFQNLEASDVLWSGAAGTTYADMLDPAEHRDLVRLVQARHVLAHQDGIVDADYIARSGDRRYTVGQRLVVTAAEVRRLAQLTEKLAAALA